MSGVGLEHIKQGAKRLGGHAVRTPLVQGINLSEECNCQIHFKRETDQNCGTFKFRGAYSKISTLPKGSTIVCASAVTTRKDAH